MKDTIPGMRMAYWSVGQIQYGAAILFALVMFRNATVIENTLSLCWYVSRRVRQIEWLASVQTVLLYFDLEFVFKKIMIVVGHMNLRLYFNKRQFAHVH